MSELGVEGAGSLAECVDNFLSLALKLVDRVLVLFS